MITEIAFEPGMAAEVGLVPVKMERLGKLVLLVGPNGHGKTRTMRLVQRTFDEVRDGEKLHKSLEAYGGANWRDRVDDAGILAAYARWERCVDGLHSTRSAKEERLLGLEYQTGAYFERADDLTRRDFASRLETARQTIDLAKAHASIDVMLTHTARTLYDAEHPRAHANTHLAAELRRVNAFDALVQALLGSKIDFEVLPSGQIVPVLFGRRFEPSELSRGQRVLLCWAHMLSQQHEELASSIIFFDEPELHLHPDACWGAIARLMSDVLGEHSQIWLATHSLPLVASACAAHGTDSLFYVHMGKVEPAGSKIEKVMHGLLGGSDQRETLNAFLGEVDALAFHQFAAQCLIAPEVAELRDGDPQGTQVTGLLRERLERGPVALLEYGAGRGRLALATARVLKTLPEETRARLTYATYHHLGFASDAEVDETREALASLAAQGAQVAMYFDQAPGKHGARGALVAEELRACEGASGRKFDLVLMANTLHEIPVTQWQRTLDDIRRVMTPEGELLIVEDQRPRIGELPHGQGFLILDKIELRELFRTEAIRGVEAMEGRLTAYAVPAAALTNVNAQSIHAALQLLERRALAEVERLRTRGASSAQAGRAHALYAMMSVNAQLTRRLIPTAS